MSEKYQHVEDDASEPTPVWPPPIDANDPDFGSGDTKKVLFVPFVASLCAGLALSIVVYVVNLSVWSALAQVSTQLISSPNQPALYLHADAGISSIISNVAIGIVALRLRESKPSWFWGLTTALSFAALLILATILV